MREEPAGGKWALPLGRRGWRAADFKRRAALLDVVAGMAFSQIVAAAIMIAPADTLGSYHKTIASAAEAASALRPLAGRLAELLFALGFIGSGLLAIPVLVGSASIGIAGLLGKEWGFSRAFREAPFFDWLIIAGTLFGMTLSVSHPVLTCLVRCPGLKRSGCPDLRGQAAHNRRGARQLMNREGGRPSGRPSLCVPPPDRETTR